MRTDHPRRCGEHRPCPVGGCMRTGSSPQMRGARDGSSRAYPWCRIIPTDAGSTLDALRSLRSFEDHPHRCGEHTARNLTMTCEQGSSPQMRGARPDSAQRHPKRGIIPADAGSTSSQEWSAWCLQDHPRRCGEHKASIFRKDDPGIIPADAGSTACVRQHIR